MGRLLKKKAGFSCAPQQRDGRSSLASGNASDQSEQQSWASALHEQGTCPCLPGIASPRRHFESRRGSRVDVAVPRDSPVVADGRLHQRRTLHGHAVRILALGVDVALARVEEPAGEHRRIVRRGDFEARQQRLRPGGAGTSTGRADDFQGGTSRAPALHAMFQTTQHAMCGAKPPRNPTARLRGGCGRARTPDTFIVLEGESLR